VNEFSRYLGYDTYIEKCSQNCVKLIVGHPDAPDELIYLQKGQFEELCRFIKENTDWKQFGNSHK
jgi:hypothetical protein